MEIQAMQRPTAGWISAACLMAAMFLWGSSFIALKLAFRAYDPMVVIFGRMAVASLCILPFVRKLRPEWLARENLKYLLFMAFCEPCLYFIFEAKAMENTTASQAGMITSMLPLLVAVTARLFLKEKIEKSTLIGFMIAIVGACWLSMGSESSPDAPNPPLGNLLEFLALVCATGYIVTLKYLTRSYSPFFLTAVQAVVGSLFYFPFLFLPSTAAPDRFEPVAALSIIYLGSFITLGAYGLYNFGVSRIPASQASAFANLIPIFAIFLGWLVLGERFTAIQCAAAVLIFTGIYVSQTGNGKERLRARAVAAPR
jgi:drug/metabolite transporter (DMT)-like permease